MIDQTLLEIVAFKKKNILLYGPLYSVFNSFFLGRYKCMTN